MHDRFKEKRFKKIIDEGYIAKGKRK